MDEIKLVALIVFVVVSGCTSTVFLSYDGERKIVKEGMEQQTITYCTDYDTKTIWVKSK